MLPGYLMEAAVRAEQNITTVMHLDDGFAWLESEAKVIYSVDRHRVIGLDDIVIDADKRLAETLFCYCSMVELQGRIGPDGLPWLEDFLSCGSYLDLNADNMRAMYEVAKDQPKQVVHVEKPDLLVLVDFLGGWEVSGSSSYDEGYQIDAVDFAGPMWVVSNETMDLHAAMLYQVEKVEPGEMRGQTALRYLKEYAAAKEKADQAGHPPDEGPATCV